MTLNSRYDEKKIAEAKEKLACHIETPAQRSERQGRIGALSQYESGNAQANMAEAASSAQKKTVSPERTEAASLSRNDFISADGRVLLTRMTSAGG